MLKAARKIKEEVQSRPYWQAAAAVLALAALIPTLFLLYRSGVGRKPAQVVVEKDDAQGEAAPQGLVVYVAGEVAVPGVYTLAEGSRVADAILAAGGALDQADVGPLNLAEKVRDGQKVYVPRVGETNGQSVEGSSGTLVNINSADAKKLQELPGIGPKLAGAIIEYRESKGGFKSVEELKRVKGIGPAKLNEIRELVTI
jgi:competence protein ComEA